MTDAQPAPLPLGRFAGREEFQNLVRSALDCAAREGWPELILSDADFWDWPLGEGAVIEALNAWVRQGRRLTLLAWASTTKSCAAIRASCAGVAPGITKLPAGAARLPTRQISLARCGLPPGCCTGLMPNAVLA